MSSFQFIFDNANALSIDTQPIVAQSMSRSNVVKSVNRGGDNWRFTITMPNGMRWSDVRDDIAKAQLLGKHTAGNVQINNPGYNSYLTNYQGDMILGGSDMTVDFVSGNTVEINTYTAGHGLTNGDITFKAGDIIQLGDDKCYTVAADVVYPATTITLHRPVIESAATAIVITIGPDVTWSVICVKFPTYTIFGRNQVQWNGPFVFYEEL